MEIIDHEQSQWEVRRRWLPWKRRFLVLKRLGGGSLLDGSNDPVDMAVGLVITVLLMLPSLIEFLVLFVLLPFALLLRAVGAIKTVVEVRCTARAVGTNDDGTPMLQTAGTFESWAIPASGFSRAGRLSNALADLIRLQGRSADVEAFADNWAKQPARS